MNRNAPMLRRTPLASRSELSPGRPLQRTRRLPYRSRKMAATYVTRRELVADLLERFPICQIQWDGGCQHLSVDVHELLSRGRGGSITDKANCCTGCRYCHDAVTQNPTTAEARGFLLKSGRPSKAVPR